MDETVMPVSGEQHEKAIECAYRARRSVGGLATEDIIAAYFASLAAQGVRLVDAREVAEWLRQEVDGHPAIPNGVIHRAFLRRFGGSDER